MQKESNFTSEILVINNQKINFLIDQNSKITINDQINIDLAKNIFFKICALIKSNTLIYNNQEIIFNQNELYDGIYKNLYYNPLAYEIGFHCSYNNIPNMKGFENKNLPYQIFLYNPINKMQLYNDNILNIIRSRERIFVHSPYTINLSSGLNLDLLIKCLQIGASANCKGIVVHTGHIVKAERNLSYLGIINNVIKILPYINPICPLLIETPAGDKQMVGEIFEEFIGIYDKIQNNGGNNLVKICIDTCHVFAAGYDPFEYIQSVNKDIIGLVHFNDSIHERGTKIDEHAGIGKGYIGAKILSLISYYCNYYQIPYINEPGSRDE